MRTSNPALKAFLNPQILDRPAAATMTFAGSIVKTGILLGLCFTTAVATWNHLQAGNTVPGYGLLLGSAIGGLVLALIICMAPRTSPFLAPVYALVEGAFVGIVSWFIPYRYGVDPSVVVPALMLTFGIAASLLVSYSLGLVRLGSTGTKMVVVATGGIMLYYVANLLLNGLLGLGLPVLGLQWEGGWLGIGVSLFVIVIASLNLVLDFQFIEAGVTNKAPRYMEWYGAFGLLVTLVWLYIEVLRLLAKVRSSD